jgi:hypothetical protein
VDLALFFVLPLIGGFAFATGFDLLRYRTGRQDSQRLYYQAAKIGVVLAVVGAVLHLCLTTVPAYASVIRSITSDLVGPLLEKERSAGTVAVSAAAQGLKVHAVFACLWGFALGVATPVWNGGIRALDWAWTRLAGRGSFLDRLNLASITDQMERLITESLINKTLLQVTLNNGKVYVGSVHESLNPASPAKYFKIQPWMSGQRSSKDGRVEFNTFYDQVLASVEGGDAMGEVAASFQLVIPIDKVVTASGFSLEAYERFELDRLDREDREKDAAKKAAAPAAAQMSPLAAVLGAAASLVAAWLAMRKKPRSDDLPKPSGP